MCMFLCLCYMVRVSIYGGQNIVTDCLELQMGGSFQTRVLGTDFLSSGRVWNSFNYWAISPVQISIFRKYLMFTITTGQTPFVWILPGWITSSAIEVYERLLSAHLNKIPKSFRISKSESNSSLYPYEVCTPFNTSLS